MNFSSFAFVSVLLTWLVVVGVLVFGKLFLERRSFRYKASNKGSNIGFDAVFDEDGSLTLGTKELQLRTSESRRLNEDKIRQEIYSTYEEVLKFQTIESALLAFDPVTVPTIVHIVKDTDSSVINEAEGKEQEQIDILNRAFLDNNMGFSFDLKAIRTHVSSEYWNEPCPKCKGSEDYSPMARATHEGDSGVLNIWFNNGPPFGFAMMGPKWGGEKEHDGVVVKHTTIYGGSNQQKNLGTLLIHEVGHWLGLDHTFQGGSCSGVGDGVSDTAPQKSPTNTCSSELAEVDTCDDGLAEANQNYMNYVDDPCASSFTPGQALRSHITWKLARESTSQFLSNLPTSRPTISVPTGSPITAYPTRGLRGDGDRDRIRDNVSRPVRPPVGIPPIDPVVEDTIPPVEVIIEDTYNCPAVWPENRTVCVMIDGFNRKKCTYYEYSADSICTCSNDDLFWTCVNGPQVATDDFAAIFDQVATDDFEAVLGLGSSEDVATTDIEEARMPDEIPVLSIMGRTSPINRIP